MTEERPSAPRRWAYPLAASLTLGLAPFSPEPHVVEKLRWVAAGGAGMAPMDLFDLVMHGAPWVWLAWSLVPRGVTSEEPPR